MQDLKHILLLVLCHPDMEQKLMASAKFIRAHQDQEPVDQINEEHSPDGQSRA